MTQVDSLIQKLLVVAGLDRVLAGMVVGRGNTALRAGLDPTRLTP